MYAGISSSKLLLTIALTLYAWPREVNKCDEKKGKFLALYKFNPQYDTGVIIKRIITYPTNTLTMAKNGVIRGLPRNEATTDQSSVKEANPSPFMPDPSCWAVTDLGRAQQSKEMLLNVEKR